MHNILENRQIEDALQRAGKRIDVLNRIHRTSHSLGSEHSKEAALKIILEICSHELGFKRAVIYVVEVITGALECCHVHGFDPAVARRIKRHKIRPGKDKSVVGLVYTSGRQQSSDGIDGIAGEPVVEIIGSAECGAHYGYVYTPITASHRAIGVLGVSYTSENPIIRKEEQGFLNLLANEIGLTIDKALFVEGTLKRREQQREFIENIFVNMMSGLVIVDCSRLLISINNYAANVLEISAREAIGQSIDSAFGLYKNLIEIIDQTIEGRKAVSCDVELTLEAGRSKYIDLHVSYLTAAGPLNRDTILLTFRDITERTRLEKIIRRSDRLVSLGTLAAGIAHEIRNPLTGISILIDELHDKVADRPRIRKVVEMAAIEIEKFENLVSGLLDFSASRESIWAACNIGEIVKQVLFLVHKQFSKTGARIFYKEDGPLPPIWADAEKIKQALLNIILNSLNVLGENGSTRITAGIKAGAQAPTDNQEIEIRIADNGPGINPEDIDFIFDPFFSRTPDGTGLGLSITHTIIKEHGGQIFVQSELGHGAIFTIHLPAMDKDYGKNTDHRR